MLIYVKYFEQCLAHSKGLKVSVIIFVFEKQSTVKISDSPNASIYNGLTSD